MPLDVWKVRGLETGLLATVIRYQERVSTNGSMGFERVHMRVFLVQETGVEWENRPAAKLQVVCGAL